MPAEVKINGYRIDTVLTGFFALDGGAMFGVVPRTLWSRVHPPDDAGRIRLAARAMLLRGKGRCILVDTGVGRKWSPRFAERYGIDIAAQRLEAVLAGLGVAPEDVSDVILTHLHFDHAGGATRPGAGGRPEPVFPRARHHLQRRNLNAARMPGARERASYLADDFAALEDAGLLVLHDGGKELFDGIELIISNGHTTGQQLVLVKGSQGSDPVGSLLYCGDLIPTRSHIPIQWHMGYDLRPLLLMEEKAILLDRAARNDWILFYEHDPLIAATRVTNTKKGFTAGSPVDLP